MVQQKQPAASPVALKSPGQRLRWHRLRLGFSQEMLAEAIGVSARSIRRWEQDQAIPQEFARQRLCQQFGIDSEDLLEALPIAETPSASSPIWHMPFHRNPFFTGRDAILEQMHSVLGCQQKVVCQSFALSGLGGVGKTQTAIEYAYRYATEYRAIFWIRAETAESILSSFATIAGLLKLSDKKEHDQNRMVEAIIHWLLHHDSWLLTFDNVEDFELVKRYLPPARHGSCLLTTRAQAPGLTGSSLNLQQMAPEEGLRFLLHRARLLTPPADPAELAPTEAASAVEIVAAMDGLPLALDQAGAYIEATHCSLSDYLYLFQSSKHSLLAERETYADHPQSVSKTFSLIFERLELRVPAAITLLTLCAFMAPEAIPEAFILEGAARLDPTFEKLAADPFFYQATLKALLSSSLLQRQTSNHTLTIHRLVQAVLKGRLDDESQSTWTRKVLYTMDYLFPSNDNANTYWSDCEQLLPHALMCLSLTRQRHEDRPQRMSLTNHVAVYLSKCARFAEAESLYQQTLHTEEPMLEAEQLLVAEALQKLGHLYGSQGKYTEAEPLFQRSLYARERALGAEHPLVAEVYSWLAVLYRHQGKYAEAEPLFQQALRIQERVLGQDHPLVVQTLFGLAALYSDQGKYSEAESIYKRALRSGESIWGPEHLRVGVILNNLANLHLKQEKYEQVESLLQRALCIWRSILEPNHPYQAHTLAGLGALYTAQGRDEQGEQFLQQALHIWEHIENPEPPEITSLLGRLADLYAKQEKFEQAEPLYLRALHMCEQMMGPEHPDVARSLQGLAELYAAQGKLMQAEPLYLRALALQQQHLGHEHPKVAESLHALALLYQRRC